MSKAKPGCADMTKDWMAREQSRYTTGTQNYCRPETEDEGTLEKVNPNTSARDLLAGRGQVGETGGRGTLEKEPGISL